MAGRNQAVAVRLPVAPAAVLTASKMPMDVSAPVVVMLSARLIQAVVDGAVVVSIAPDGRQRRVDVGK